MCGRFSRYSIRSSLRLPKNRGGREVGYCLRGTGFHRNDIFGVRRRQKREKLDYLQSLLIKRMAVDEYMHARTADSEIISESFDPKDVLNVRIDRKRKLPCTTFLMALIDVPIFKPSCQGFIPNPIPII